MEARGAHAWASRAFVPPCSGPVLPPTRWHLSDQASPIAAQRSGERNPRCSLAVMYAPFVSGVLPARNVAVALWVDLPQPPEPRAEGQRFPDALPKVGPFAGCLLPFSRVSWLMHELCSNHRARDAPPGQPRPASIPRCPRWRRQAPTATGMPTRWEQTTRPAIRLSLCLTPSISRFLCPYPDQGFGSDQSNSWLVQAYGDVQQSLTQRVIRAWASCTTASPTSSASRGLRVLTTSLASQRSGRRIRRRGRTCGDPHQRHKRRGSVGCRLGCRFDHGWQQWCGPETVQVDPEVSADLPDAMRPTVVQGRAAGRTFFKRPNPLAPVITSLFLTGLLSNPPVSSGCGPLRTQHAAGPVA